MGVLCSTLNVLKPKLGAFILLRKARLALRAGHWNHLPGSVAAPELFPSSGHTCALLPWLGGGCPAVREQGLWAVGSEQCCRWGTVAEGQHWSVPGLSCWAAPLSVQFAQTHLGSHRDRRLGCLVPICSWTAVWGHCSTVLLAEAFQHWGQMWFADCPSEFSPKHSTALWRIGMVRSSMQSERLP